MSAAGRAAPGGGSWPAETQERVWAHMLEAASTLRVLAYAAAGADADLELEIAETWSGTVQVVIDAMDHASAELMDAPAPIRDALAPLAKALAVARTLELALWRHRQDSGRGAPSNADVAMTATIVLAWATESGLVLQQHTERSPKVRPAIGLPPFH